MITRQKTTRTRIAPSPTGYLHIGTARTALFNWLFARQNGGEFILRIEDTDLERSDPRFEKDIIENLKWLGLDWDIGPVKQSDRLEIYEKYINQLLEKKLAYYCFCSKEELEQDRQAMLTQGLAPKYSGKCRNLSEEETQKNLAGGLSHVIRFRVPESIVEFKDLIRGDVRFDAALLGDMAIAKDLWVPLYNFAVVIDDYEMEISHVIRGEDHLANTPKQILLQAALGFPQPEYAHLPLILDPDRHKMSKRFSATSVAEYREQGYLPEALINFMALLGWHPQDNREIFNKEELIKEFDLSRVQKAGAVFNVEKLDWVNAQYIKKIDDEQLARLLDIGDNAAIIPLIRDRLKKLSDFKTLADWFKKPAEYAPELLIWKNTEQAVILENLKSVAVILENGGGAEDIMKLAEEKGKGEILWPLRAALSGKDASPGPLEMMAVLGKQETLKRVNLAIKKLEV